MADTINEQWASFGAPWTAGEAGLSVTSNKLFSSVAGFADAIRPFEPGAGVFRIAGSVNFKTGGTAGKGVSVGVATSTVATEFEAWWSIGIDLGGKAMLFKPGADLELGTGLGEGLYLVTIVGDANGISFTLMKSDRSAEYRAHFTRAEVGTIKELLVVNADKRGSATGSSVGAVGARLDLNTLETRTNIEGLGTSRSYTTLDGGGRKIRIEQPAAYDSRVEADMVPFAHGIEETQLENTVIDRTERAPVFKELLEHGYVIASTDLGGASVYGNTGSAEALEALSTYLKANYPVKRIALMGFSGGAAAVAVTVRRGNVPAAAMLTVSGYYNTDKTKNKEGSRKELFKAAYGLTGTEWPDFEEKVITPHLDPVLYEFGDFHAVPVGLMSSPEESTELPKTENSDLIQAILEGHSTVKAVATTGKHSTSGNWKPEATRVLLGELLEAHALSATLSVTQAQVASLVKAITRVQPTITQPQVVTKRAALARALNTSQVQVGTFKRELARKLSTTQGEVPSVQRVLAKPLSAAQPQVVTKRAALARALNTSQVQVGTFKRELARKLSTTQGEVPSVQRVLAKPLSAAQPQVVTKRAALARALNTSQVQVGTFKRELARKLSTTQGEVPSVQRVLAKPLSAAQPQVVTKRAALARALNTSQVQVSELGPRVLNRLLEVSQAQAATIVERVTKTFALGQPQVAKLAREPSRLLKIAQAQIAKLRRFRRLDVVPVPVISVIVTPTPAVTTVIIT